MRNSYFIKNTLCCFILATFFSACNPGTQKSSEEVHNAATQTIPEEAKELLGRWDLTIDKNGIKSPSWLEIKLSGFHVLVGNFVAESGSVRPVSQIHLKDGNITFSIPPQWEGGDRNIQLDGKLNNGKLEGTFTNSKSEKYSFIGEKAPYLVRKSALEWSTPIELFNGKDLKGWKLSSEDNQWKVENGILINQKAGANLISEQQFEDFKLLAEFRYKKGGNSGIYLRGRYEVQIEDSALDRHPGSLYYGGVYGFLTPSEIATLGPNEWNSYEITLIGRKVTIIANGKTIISNQEIPGITGGALDSREAEPGPIYLQGDHSEIEFRRITIVPTK